MQLKILTNWFKGFGEWKVRAKTEEIEKKCMQHLNIFDRNDFKG